MRNNMIKLLFWGLLSCWHIPAAAFDYFISGFGTASVSCATNDNADYVINDQPEGPGRSRTCDAGTDSLFGLQLDLAFTEDLEFGVQVIADRDEDRAHLPDVNVAQLRWRAMDDLTIRLGRMPTPSFLFSESRQVRFSMPWVRPPLEVYGLLPTFSHDGVEFIFQDNYAGWLAEWHSGVTYLEFDTPLTNSKDTELIESYGGFLNLTLENDNTLIKLSYSYSETSFTTAQMESLFAVLASPLFAEGKQLVDDLRLDQSPTHLAAFGFRHYHEDWLVMGEFSFRTIDSFFRDQFGAYLTVAHQFGSWMPYLTLARRWTSGPDSDARAGFLQAEVGRLLTSSRYDASRAAIGLAQDFNEYIRIKVQTEWIQPDHNSWGLYTNHGSDYDYRYPKSNWLFTLSVDFVF